MRAMILAAGRGERLRPLTDACPKPLLSIGSDSLISRHLKHLKRSGFEEVIINHAWLGSKIEETLGDGSQFGLTITYSPEEYQKLETAGGIKKALPLLGHEPFLVINGDILTDFDFKDAFQIQKQLKNKRSLAHLWLTSNPISHHPTGDYSINEQGLLIEKTYPCYTFSGIAVYHPDFFNEVPDNTYYKLVDLFNLHLPKKIIQAKLLPGLWMDVGTIERINLAKQLLQAQEVSLDRH